jgi:hypothetical protein
LEGCKKADYLRPGVSAPGNHEKTSLYKKNEATRKSENKHGLNITAINTSFGAPIHLSNSVQSNKYCIPRAAADSQGIGHIQIPMLSNNRGNDQKRPIDLEFPTVSVTHVSDSLQNTNNAPIAKADVYASSTDIRGKTVAGNLSSSTGVSSLRNNLWQNSHFVDLDDEDDEILQVILHLQMLQICGDAISHV